MIFSKDNFHCEFKEAHIGRNHANNVKSALLDVALYTEYNGPMYFCGNMWGVGGSQTIFFSSTTVTSDNLYIFSFIDVLVALSRSQAVIALHSRLHFT